MIEHSAHIHFVQGEGDHIKGFLIASRVIIRKKHIKNHGAGKFIPAAKSAFFVVEYAGAGFEIFIERLVRKAGFGRELFSDLFFEELHDLFAALYYFIFFICPNFVYRSEERRVGKECISWWRTDY